MDQWKLMMKVDDESQLTVNINEAVSSIIFNDSTPSHSLVNYSLTSVNCSYNINTVCHWTFLNCIHAVWGDGLLVALQYKVTLSPSVTGLRQCCLKGCDGSGRHVYPYITDKFWHNNTNTIRKGMAIKILKLAY